MQQQQIRGQFLQFDGHPWYFVFFSKSDTVEFGNQNITLHYFLGLRPLAISIIYERLILTSNHEILQFSMVM